MGESIVAFEYKDSLKDGVILHLLLCKEEGTERYKIDLDFDAFKKLLWVSKGVLDKHRDKITN